MFVSVYILPVRVIVFWMIAVFLFWTLMNSREKKSRVWSCFNLLVLAAYTGALLYYTVFSREGGAEGDGFRPLFSAFRNYAGDSETWRMLFMNAVLMMPVGLSLSTVLSQRFPGIVSFASTVAACLLLSGIIEFLQYRYLLGTGEADDILMNTLGGLFGALTVLIKIDTVKLKQEISRLLQRLRDV